MENEVDIYNDGFKECIFCHRTLPNNNLYFPRDKNCKDGLRNKCRECDKKYGKFLSEDHQANKRWSDEDLQLLKSVYKDYSNKEIQAKFFPDRTIRGIESIASKRGFNHKSEETLKRIKIDVAKIVPQCQKGVIFSDEHKKHISDSAKKRYENPQEIERARQNAYNRKLWQGDNNPAHLHPLYGDKNGRWNGGNSDLIVQLRRDIVDWKKESAEFCSYKCIFTGGRFQNIHHIVSFSSLLNESIKENNLSQKLKVNDYSKDEYKQLKETLIKIHKKTYFGACLCKEIHELFHKEYSYYDSTVYDFLDFSQNIINGYYDQFFKEHSLSKTINHDYINYLVETKEILV